MSRCDFTFDPVMIESESKQFYFQNSARIDSKMARRGLFYNLNQQVIDESLMLNAHQFVIDHLNLTNSLSLYSDLDKPISLETLQLLKPAKTPVFAEQLVSDNNLKYCIEQTAIIYLNQPIWLKNISQISCAQSTLALQIMTLYQQLIANGKDQKLSDLYRSMVLSYGVKLPDVHSYQFSQQSEICAEMFEFSAIQQALAIFPRIFFPEILGFTLAYIKSPTVLETCFPEYLKKCKFFSTHKNNLQLQKNALLQVISNYLNLFSEQQQDLSHRIIRGYVLYTSQIESCINKLSEQLEKSWTTQQTVARLFNQKAVAAIGHHQQIKLENIPLDKWFAELPERNTEFLAALSQSAYVNKDNPKASKLIKLFEFNGPMFGVFEKSELDVLEKWIGRGMDKESIYLSAESGNQNKHLTSAVSSNSIRKQANYSNQQLYHYLLNADLHPDVLPIAKKKLLRQLLYCSKLNHPPFKQYSHNQFDHYIEQIYSKEMEAYQPLQGKPKISKQAYIWGLEQIAPMILIDGCWLQNSLSLQSSHPKIADILFTIFADELGNGRLEQNHPYIFAQLLDSLSIQLPTADKQEFIDHPGFINSAFDLPVYMLTLSNFSLEFLPELLGLNMAIEISGLGKSYMSLVDEWNYWGINPTIASIHISIDNYASGHTFLAKKAVQLYMDKIYHQTGSQKTVNDHWNRIHNGYASLRFVGAKFRLALPLFYLMNKVRNKFAKNLPN